MRVDEFLETFKEMRVRPRVTCADGFSVSIQNFNSPSRKIYTVELGYPSEEIPSISQFSENKFDLLDSVYPFMDIELVEGIIAQHGGIDHIQLEHKADPLNDCRPQYIIYISHDLKLQLSDIHTLEEIQDWIDPNHTKGYDRIIRIKIGNKNNYYKCDIGYPISHYEPFDELGLAVSGKTVTIVKKRSVK